MPSIVQTILDLKVLRYEVTVVILIGPWFASIVFLRLCYLLMRYQKVLAAERPRKAQKILVCLSIFFLCAALDFYKLGVFVLLPFLELADSFGGLDPITLRYIPPISFVSASDNMDLVPCWFNPLFFLFIVSSATVLIYAKILSARKRKHGAADRLDDK